MKLTLVSSKDDVCRVRCEGEVTQADFPDDLDPFLMLLGPDCFSARVLVDLEHTTLIDTAGIGWLVMSHKRFEENGGMLVLHSIPPLVDHIFRLLKMPSVLHITSSAAVAQTLVPGGAP